MRPKTIRRDAEIIRHARKGLNSKQIALKMKPTSVWTVYKTIAEHKKRLAKKRAKY